MSVDIVTSLKRAIATVVEAIREVDRFNASTFQRFNVNHVPPLHLLIRIRW